MPVLELLLSVSFAAHPIPATLTEAAYQPGGRPPRLREHTAIQKGELELVPATEEPIAESWIEITIEGEERVIRTNSISKHKTGKFPNPGNPNRISEQDLEYRLPLEPKLADAPIYYQLGTFGVALNGVVLEPQAAEWYLGQAGSKWQYDPLGAAIELGLDEYVAHVQPQGMYHYHAKPKLYDGVSADEPGKFVFIDFGTALDGFPIRLAYGDVTHISSGWRLKTGDRPVGEGLPGGTYDGTFVADYEFVGETALNECNAMQITEEDGSQTWAYFLTDTFPFIPRCFIGEPIEGAILMNGEGQMVGLPPRR